MASLNDITLALSRKYTDETVEGGGAIKGKNCVIKKIERDGSDNLVTFQWTLDSGVEKTETMRVPGGESGISVVGVETVADKPAIVFIFSDGTESQEILIPTVKGDPGFSPTVEVVSDTQDTYRLKITTEEDEIITPNLKGSSGDYEPLENKPSINGTVLYEGLSLDDIGVGEITQAELSAMWD